jgi:hypothetical protein
VYARTKRLPDRRRDKAALGVDVAGAPYKSCWLAAYVIHDWWCDQAREMAAIDRPEAVKIRLEGDLLFNECLAFLGANRASRRAHWIGVRAGAWASGLGR